MSQAKREILDANESYAATFGAKVKLPTPPSRKIFLLTCMDARLDPAKFAGLAEGDAHVFRNAGGRATDDAIRSLVISHKLLGTNEWFVIHHTECGMQSIDDKIMGTLLESSLATADFDGKNWSNAKNEGGSSEGHFIKWLTISEPNAAVVEDVRRIRNHALVPSNVTIYGFILDLKTGKLIEVEEASEIGKATTACGQRRS